MTTVKTVSLATELMTKQVRGYGILGLLTVLKKVKQKEQELRLLMPRKPNHPQGFSTEAVDTISPTLGFNIKTLEHQGFKLNIWDVGGRKSLRSYWWNYFETMDGPIRVVDSADRQRGQDCQHEPQRLLVEEELPQGQDKGRAQGGHEACTGI
ncbi:ADP-ribosylation factor-like protein 2 [Acomys russatus]|uniref:ADP-ribosylation factor-like protein 2 n=1 Tax=Acomys russatus TaxID=60746 RepID=UPI0021E31E43|nr:ADP-ribosylation factor-like protein 2 [Acomys russatus]